MNGSSAPAGPVEANSKRIDSWLRAAWRQPGWVIGLALAAITLAIYLPVVGFEFLEFDDDRYVTLNGMVRQGLTFEGLVWAFRGFHVANWHPLTMLSHMLDCSLFDLAAGGHHFTNVLFHATNSVLLFGLLRRLTGAVWRPAVVAALFALHPLHVESVAWVSERKDVLSTFFLILTVWAYIRYAEKPGWGRYWMVVLWFALGLMAKPMLVTLPGVLLLLDYWPLGRWRVGDGVKLSMFLPGAWVARRGGPGDGTDEVVAEEAARQRRPTNDGMVAEEAARQRCPTTDGVFAEKVPLLVLSFIVGVLTMLAQQEGNAVISLHSVPFWSRLGNVVIGYAGYLEKMVWPADLCAFYPWPERIPTVGLVCSAVVLGGISLLAWNQRKECPCVAVGWLWYLITMVPVIGLVQVGGQWMADRYTYVPLLGIFVGAVWGVAPWFERWSGRRLIQVAVPGIILAGCLAGTASQLQYWRNGVSLFTRCLEVAPESFLAHHNLGIALSGQGRKSEAVIQFNESLRLYPNNAKAHFMLGVELTDLGETAEAVAHYKETIRIKPSDAAAHLNLGVLLAQQGQSAAAVESFLAALSLEPENPRVHLNLAIALNQQGKTTEALRHYRAAVELQPAWPEALNRLACILATHRDARFRDGAAAVRLAEAVDKLTGHSQPVFLNSLAAAYAEAGRFADAVAVEEHALQLAVASGRSGMAPQMQRCLQLYRSGSAYRDEE